MPSWRDDPRRFGGSINAIEPKESAAIGGTGIGGTVTAATPLPGIGGAASVKPAASVGQVGGTAGALWGGVSRVEGKSTGREISEVVLGEGAPQKLAAKYLGVSNPFGGGLGAPEPNTLIFDHYYSAYAEANPAPSPFEGGALPLGSDTGSAPVSGDGFTIDAILYGVKMHESGGSYTIQNQSGSSASGAYQYLDSTWNGYGGYSRAMYAPPEVQDARARQDFAAAFSKYGNWDQAIMSHFGGPGFASDPSNFSSIPGAPGYNNPTGRTFLDSVYSKASSSPFSSASVSDNGPPPAGPTVSGGQMGDALSAAYGMLGTPYVWGGSTSQGVDCSGLVYYAYNAAGIKIPRMRAIDYGKMGTSVTLDQAQPGDLIYTDNPNTTTDHIGIYVGNGQYIQAPTTGQNVAIINVSNYTSIRRIADPGAYDGMATDGQGSKSWSTNGQQFASMPDPNYAMQPFQYKRPAAVGSGVFGSALYAMA